MPQEEKRNLEWPSVLQDWHPPPIPLKTPEKVFKILEFRRKLPRSIDVEVCGWRVYTEGIHILSCCVHTASKSKPFLFLGFTHGFPPKPQSGTLVSKSTFGRKCTAFHHLRKPLLVKYSPDFVFVTSQALKPLFWTITGQQNLWDFKGFLKVPWLILCPHPNPRNCFRSCIQFFSCCYDKVPDKSN